jgi:hypothetical protein
MRSESSRFAILGDTHFCTEKIRGVFKDKSSLGDLPDYARYAPMVNDIFAPVIDRINSLNPDFVISTGDFVEGGMNDNPECTAEEIRQGWAFMKKLNCPCFIAKGTHEGSGNSCGAESFRRIVMPEMLATDINGSRREYYSFEKAGAAFFILDYLDYKPGNAQDKWLENGLKKAQEKGHRIFIAAHPPLYNWGRHFFNEPEFINRIIELCAAYPVDAYFCGHTHNQTLSFHKGGKGKGYLQIMGSTVGYRDFDMVSLEEYHSIAEFSDSDTYIWGIQEDSSPGFHLVEINRDDSMDISWYSFKGDSASLRVEKRGAVPLVLKMPEYRPIVRVASEKDLRMIKTALLNLFGICRDNRGTEVFINEVSVGSLPCNVSYAARRYLIPGLDALKQLGRKNLVTIKTPVCDSFVLGSFSLELQLWDGRIIKSGVNPETFIHGDNWKEFPQPGKTREVLPGDEISFELIFE